MSFAGSSLATGQECMSQPGPMKSQNILEEDDVLDDDELYGAPSSDEDRAYGSQPKQLDKVSGNEDDLPLGNQGIDLQAAHERIIGREKQAQTKRTLSILERKKGRAPTEKTLLAAHSITQQGSRPQDTKPTSAMHKRSSSESFAAMPIAPAAYASQRLLRSATSRSPSRPRPSRATPEVPPLGNHAAYTRSEVHRADSAANLRRNHTIGRTAPAITSPPQSPSRQKIHSPPPPPSYTAYNTTAMHPVHEASQALSRITFHSPPTLSSPLVTYRVFVLNVQRYTVVHLPEDAVVRQMLQAVITQMPLAPSKDPLQDWALVDVLSELGIERPLREYERIDHIVQARGNDAGFFLVKVSEWSSLLHIQDLPSFSAALGGWVSIQTEPRKWSKRWIELREHALFTAMSESVRYLQLTQGKHASPLCAMIDVDLYLIDSSRSALSKPFGFALRRVGTQTIHNRTVAYITQSDEAAHHDWVKGILNARTYVLRQEFPELFFHTHTLPPIHYPSATSPKHGSSTHLARRPTMNDSMSAPQRVRSHRELRSAASASPPLISPESLSMQFQQGSLLATRSQPDKQRSHARNPPP
ncbi:hypothetical protein MYAM1_004020 [Malassezia yamatoensis]|uniref:PH domain-containing protein n=1 Tax=Malassezia yamatoensis TaxID=253288 RepID=A0AAJ5Z117_9BASI|nr:hypothetical protein MYAM1_004020 [Malassezia yamatoensis]